MTPAFSAAAEAAAEPSVSAAARHRVTQLPASLQAIAVYEASPAALQARLNTVADLLQITNLTP